MSHLARMQTLLHFTFFCHGTYQLNMAFGLVYIGIADEPKFANKVNNFSEIFSRFLKPVAREMVSSSTDKIVSKLISKCLVLKNTFKKGKFHGYGR